MAEPFLSEIRMVSFNFPPKNWALTNGQLLPINQNQGLFALLGTTFGGDGRVNFALPDFRGRTPIHVGNNHNLGDRGGAGSHTLSISEIPTHGHLLKSSDNPNQTDSTSPINNFFSNSIPANVYHSSYESAKVLHSGTIGNTGGSQAHLNMQPFLTLSFCIALVGIFPSPN